jgi:ABC-type xylose transport system permease subunit
VSVPVPVVLLAAITFVAYAGSIGGTVVGAFIIGVLSNGLNLLGIQSYYRQVIKGIVFILAVMLDLFTKQRR